MKFKKLAKMTLAMTLVFGASGILSACKEDEQKNTSVEKTEQEKVYDLYVSYTSAKGDVPLTYKEWLASIKGVDGEKGEKGDTGAEWLSANRPPNYDEGVEGDFFFDSKNNHIYEKVDEETWELIAKIGNGKDGEDGKTGNGISSIEHTETKNNVHTYTISFTDQTMTPVTFQVRDGERGEDGVSIVSASINNQGELLITLSNNEVPINLGIVKGQNLTITDITTVTGATADTYKIVYSDGQELEFSVKHGKDGTIWLYDEGEPSSSIVTLKAKEGDFYFDRANNDIYIYHAGNWICEVNLPDDEIIITSLSNGEYSGYIDGQKFVLTVTNGNATSLEFVELDMDLEVSNIVCSVEDGVVDLSFDVSVAGEGSMSLQGKFVVNNYELETYMTQEDYELIKGQYFADGILTVTSTSVYYASEMGLISGEYKIVNASDGGIYEVEVTIDNNTKITLYLDSYSRTFNTAVKDFSGTYTLSTSEGDTTIIYDQRERTLDIDGTEFEILEMYRMDDPTRAVVMFEINAGESIITGYEFNYLNKSITRVAAVAKFPFIGDVVGLVSDFENTEAMIDAYYRPMDKYLERINQTTVYSNGNVEVMLNLDMFNIEITMNGNSIYNSSLMDLPQPVDNLVTVIADSHLIDIELDGSEMITNVEVHQLAKTEDELLRLLNEGESTIYVGSTVEITQTIELKHDVTFIGIGEDHGMHTIIAKSNEFNSIKDYADGDVYSLFYIPNAIKVTFENMVLDGNAECRSITSLRGTIILDSTIITNGVDKGVYRSGGVFAGYSSSFIMNSGMIVGNSSGVENDDVTVDNYFKHYSSDLWIGANSSGSIVVIGEAALIGNVFVNSNEYSANNPGSFTLDGGTIQTLYIEYDAGYGATFHYKKGQVLMMKISTTTPGVAFEDYIMPMLTPNTTYQGGVPLATNPIGE